MSNKTRFAELCVDIGESTVKIIKINRDGVIVRAGRAQIDPLPEDAAERIRIQTLTAAIKKAAKAARIAGGSCTLVTGGPHVIVRRYTWPDMPPDALRVNAASEIQPYLPGSGEQFQISCRIIGKTSEPSPETGKLIAKLDLLVAAISKSDALRLRTAAKKAGFSVKRIDIRENAREKLVEHKKLWADYRLRAGNLGGSDKRGAFVPTGSFVILDLADALVNMTVFVGGKFYANRYFSANLSEIQNSGGSGDSDTTAQEIYEFAENLAAEAASVIDYVHYRERGSFIRSVLLLGGGEAAADFIESFCDNIDIPVINEAAALNEVLASRRLKKRDETEIVHFLDAYGAAIIPDDKRDYDLDLRSRMTNKSKKLLPAACLLVLLLAAIGFFGFYLPQQKIIELETAIAMLEYPETSVSDADILALRLEIENARLIDTDVSEFYSQYPPASWVLSTVYGVLPAGTGLNEVIFDYGTITLRGCAAGLTETARYIRNLRRSGLFYGDIIHSIGNIPRNGESGRLGFTVRAIDAPYENGAVDFELTLVTAELLEDFR